MATCDQCSTCLGRKRQEVYQQMRSAEADKAAHLEKVEAYWDAKVAVLDAEWDRLSKAEDAAEELEQAALAERGTAVMQ